MKTTVTYETKANFQAEINQFIADLNTFLDGNGPMPEGNVELIKEKHIKLSIKDMMQSGTPRGLAQRVSKHVLSEMLETKMAAA